MMICVLPRRRAASSASLSRTRPWRCRWRSLRMPTRRRPAWLCPMNHADDFAVAQQHVGKVAGRDLVGVVLIVGLAGQEGSENSLAAESHDRPPILAAIARAGAHSGWERRSF